MQIKQHMKLKLSKQKLLLMIAAMPFIDTFNGMFHAALPIGQLYRMFLFSFLLLEYASFGRKKFLNFLMAFTVFCTIQILVGFSYCKKSIIDTFKLFLPILMMLVFKEKLIRRYITQDDVLALFDFWSWLYPLLIMVPELLGMGDAAYEGGTGVKGFFYAVNEISFIESSLIMYSIYRLSQQISWERIILLFANCLCVLLMGTKTGYATIVVFVLLYFLVSFRRKKMNVFVKNFFFILLILISALCGIWIFKEQISAIWVRWIWQRKFVSTSAMDFLLSNRLRRWEGAFRTFIEGGYVILGWGFGGELAGFANMEMDWFDLLFRTGLIGFSGIAIFYFWYFKKYTCKMLLPMFIIFWSMVLVFGAGHVLFYGQSGMMLAMLFAVTMKFHTNIINKASS